MEIARFLELRKERGLHIVPVILFACDWKNESWLAATQAYPGGGKTLGDFKTRAARAGALQGLLERLRSQIKDAGVGALAPKTAAPAVRIEQRIADLMNLDPVVNAAAADSWLDAGIQEFEALGEEIWRVQMMNARSVQRVCAGSPRESGTMLQRRVFAADQDWHRGRGAADSFTVAHRTVCASSIAVPLRDDPDLDFDIGRNCLTALGQMVAYTWGPEVLRAMRGSQDNLGNYLTSSYAFEKYHSYSVEALAKFVAGATDSDEAFYALERLADAIGFADRYSLSGENYRNHAVRAALATCQPIQADEIARRWCSHANPKIRRFGAFALGQLRLSRLESELERMLSDVDRRVAEAAAVALANVGTPTAADVIMQRDDVPPYAVALALDAVTDEQLRRERTGELLRTLPWEHAWLAIRAVGFHRLAEFRAEVQNRLASRTATDRGVAALALARISGKAVAAQVRRAWEEAGDPIERVITTVAVVAIGDRLSSDAVLRMRSDLCAAGFFLRPIREDVLQILDDSGSPDLARIAAAWKPLYDAHIDY